jgi:large subunit ribosomal protein L23
MAKTKEKTVVEESKKTTLSAHAFFGTLLRPRITEKASQKATENNVYVFEVPVSANKKEIARAVTDFYKVTALKIAVVPIPRKQVTVRGKKGQTASGKKAYVYLKKGDKIEFI